MSKYLDVMRMEGYIRVLLFDKLQVSFTNGYYRRGAYAKIAIWTPTILGIYVLTFDLCGRSLVVLWDSADFEDEYQKAVNGG